ncbi:MAG: phosphotransferase [Ilumatobacteraceae bacterium]
MAKVVPDVSTVAAFLRERFADVDAVELLNGGDWSSAFGFISDGSALVARFGEHGEDYAKDAIAAGWASPDLPVPRVVEVGEGLDGWFCVSERHVGTKLHEAPPERFQLLTERLFDVLDAIRAIELPGTGYGMWDAPDCDAFRPTWREYLVQSVTGLSEDRLTDWHRHLDSWPGATAALERGAAALAAMVHVCPEQRHVIHNDLLLNTLVAPDGRITAVFDWGNSLAGDPLYDIALLLNDAADHPGLDEQLVMAMTR